MLQRAVFTAMAAGALALGLLLVSSDAVAPDVGAAREAPTMRRGASGPQGTPLQAEERSGGDDTRVPVQVWTVLAAGGAAALGLLLFLVRIAAGRVPPPPPQEEAHH